MSDRRWLPRTTCHVIARDPVHRVGRLVIDVAHPDAGAVSLIDAVDEEVGKERVGVDRLGGSHCQQHGFEVGEMHDFGPRSFPQRMVGFATT